MFKKPLALVLGSVISFVGLSAHAQDSSSIQAEKAKQLQVQENMEVVMEYVLSVDGSVFASTEGREPFRYIQGRRQVIPGLERQMAGLKVGDSKRITINPEEGYGPIDSSAVVEIDRSQLPQDASPEVGMVLGATSAEGEAFQAKIVKIDGSKITLDLNHPLAGKVLVFDVKVIAINPKN